MRIAPLINIFLFFMVVGITIRFGIWWGLLVIGIFTIAQVFLGWNEIKEAYALGGRTAEKSKPQLVHLWNVLKGTEQPTRFIQKEMERKEAEQARKTLLEMQKKTVEEKK